MLEHGGDLRRAAARYDMPLASWLDLSTGINPQGWPVPLVPAAAWARLPEESDALEAAARTYYATASLLPVAGSQAAIQTLPRLRAPCRAGVLHPGYAEHASAWRRAGHTVSPVTADAVDKRIDELDVLVLIHPNNPTGARFSIQDLLSWHARLAARGGWLLVDEAFIDPTPEHSLARHCPRPGLIVLRSLGKFFGLAGLRLGFVLAPAALCDLLRDELGPWPVNGPARWVATQALRDRAWQEAMRGHLMHHGERLATVLTRAGLPPQGGTPFFQWVCTSRAASLHRSLARQAILVRLFCDPPSLRFGLPGEESGWSRLEAALGK